MTDLVDTTSELVLTEVNKAARRQALAPWVGSGVALIAVLTLLSVPWLTLFVLVGGGWWVRSLHRRDVVKRTTPLVYDLDPAAQQQFDALSAVVASLAGAAKTWRIQARQYTPDWKRNAGANSLVNRGVVTMGVRVPPCLATNVLVQGIPLGDLQLFFLPDRLFVLQRGQYGAVGYGDLRVEYRSVRFSEDGPVPSDAQIVGQTWQYVRRDGGPDRRFRNNRQLPIALYGQVELVSSTGLDIVLQVSKSTLAEQFAAFFRPPHAQRSTSSSPGEQPGRARASAPRPSQPARRSASDVLGLKPGATLEEIKAAYRRLVQQYHPDKVATMAPEFTELAERRMREINAAYATLTRPVV